MSRQIPERDWKFFRKVREAALERYCERVLREIAELTATKPSSYSQRYLEVFKLIDERDDELGRTFDDLRRSTALFQLAAIRALDLLTDEELSTFTAEPQEIVRMLVGR